MATVDTLFMASLTAVTAESVVISTYRVSSHQCSVNSVLITMSNLLVPALCLAVVFFCHFIAMLLFPLKRYDVLLTSPLPVIMDRRAAAAAAAADSMAA